MTPTALNDLKQYEHPALTVRVYRHGGRSSDKWRLVGESVVGGEAVVIFNRAKQPMKQGGLVMIGQDGNLLRTYEAPLLRSRW